MFRGAHTCSCAYPWSPRVSSSQHSWDYGNKGEVNSLNTTLRLVDEMADHDLVLHIGDIRYGLAPDTSAVPRARDWPSTWQCSPPSALYQLRCGLSLRVGHLYAPDKSSGTTAALDDGRNPFARSHPAWEHVV